MSHFCRCALYGYFTCILMMLGVVASSAKAQGAFGAWNESPGWMDNRDRRQGSGLRVGDLELHPGIGIEGGWDSNVYYQEADPQASAILRVSPHLILSTLGEERMKEAEADELPRFVFETALTGSLYHYFVDEAQDNMSAGAKLNLQVNPKRTFSLRLYDEFSRSVRPFTQAVRGTNPYNFGRDRNVVGMEASLSSRGEVLVGTLGYSFGFDLFEDDVFIFGNNLQHTVLGRVAWRFLPETALVYETTLGLVDYTNTGHPSATSLLVDDQQFHSRLGLNGALTQQLSFSVFGGYAVGFYDVADDYDGLIAMAELRWKPHEQTELSLGYDRDYFNSFMGNFYRRDRGYTRAELLLARAFLLGIEADVGTYNYGLGLNPDGALLGTQARRDDLRLSARLYGEYRVRNWLGFTASLGYSSILTDFDYFVNAGSGAAVMLDPAKYQKFEAWLGSRVFF